MQPIWKINFIDGDMLVVGNNSIGENRAWVTSAVITGLYIGGDDCCEGGSKEGKERGKKFLANPEVDAVAQGESFRPLEGNG